MVDTTTTVLGLVKQTIGGNRNTWGAILNSCMDLIEGAFYGMTSKLVTGGSYTLTDAERRKRILAFTGTLGSNQIIVLANLVGVWLVRNGTAGAFSLSFKTSSGDPVVVAQGTNSIVWCDGNDVVRAITANDLGISNVTFAMLASALIASQANAQAMTASDVLMTPQRVWDAIWAFKGEFINVIDKDILTPPGVPAEGDRYFVGGVGLSGWAGFDNKFVEYRGAAWVSFSLVTEQRVIVRDEKRVYRWTGSALVIDMPYFPVLAPAQITASQDNYQPTGRTSAGVLVLDINANRALTGIVPNYDGELLPIINGTTGFSLTLTDASASSTAANRFSFGTDIVIGPGKAAMLIYQGGSVNRWRLLQPPAATKSGLLPFAQCKLIKSGSNLVLMPCDGNLITINGSAEVIPDAGVSLAGAGSSGSLGYIYVYMNAGVMTLETAATVPAVQAGTGMPIKTGDATRTLVGMGRPGTGPAWVDTASQRFVRSYFNDPGCSLLNVLTSNVVLSPTSFAELSTALRVEFLSWANEVAPFSFSGSVNNNAGDFTYTCLAFDGLVAEEGMSNGTGSSGSYLPFAATVQKSGLSEGYHYATLVGRSPSGTNTWIGSATAGARTSLQGSLRK